MKNITLAAFHNMLYAEFTQLQSVERLLNEEGRATHKALWDLINVCPFYETIEEYAQDQRVQQLCKKYQNCRSVQTYAWMLDRVKEGAAE